MVLCTSASVAELLWVEKIGGVNLIDRVLTVQIRLQAALRGYFDLLFWLLPLPRLA